MSTTVSLSNANIHGVLAAESHSHSTLSFGSWGGDVQTLQHLLNSAITPSPNLKEDGDFGAKTELAVIGFQAAHGLVPDGIVGKLTWAALAPYHEGGSISLYAGSGHGTGGANGKPTPRRDKTNHLRAAAPEPKAVPSLTGGHACAEIIHRAGKAVPHFWQGDPRWGACAVGNGRSMACIGCAVTSMAMVMAYYGRDVNPGTLNEYLGRTSFLGRTSMLNWQAACGFKADMGPHLVAQWIDDSRTYRDRINKRIAKGLPSVAHVDYGRDGDAAGNHFIVIVGRAPDGSLVMNDPAVPGGNGALHWQDRQNRIEYTSRGGGYRIVDLCAIDAV
jgi:hypothetical protein